MKDDCRKFEDLLAARVLGDISAADEAALRAHMEGCPRCRGELAAMLEAVSLMKREMPARSPRGLAAKTIHSLERTACRIPRDADRAGTELFRPSTWRVRKSLVGWLVAASVLIMAVASLVPGINDVETRRQIDSCQGNLRLVGMALRQYATDQGGVYPQGPQWHASLDWQYLEREGNGALSCPGCQAVGAPGRSKIDYVYNPTRVDMNAPGDYPLLWDRKSAHGKAGRNVLFADGGVRWVEEIGFEKLLVRYRIDDKDTLGGYPAAGYPETLPGAAPK